MKRPISLISGISLVVASQMFAQQAKRTSVENASDLSVYETVIRFQIKSWELAAHTYCVEVNGRDGDPTLLQRLVPLPVKGASACRKLHDRSALMSVVDRKTRKRSVIFNLGSIRQVSSSEVEVEGGYLCGSQCMAEGVYRVVRDANSWRVANFEPTVMS